MEVSNQLSQNMSSRFATNATEDLHLLDSENDSKSKFKFDVMQFSNCTNTL